MLLLIGLLHFVLGLIGPPPSDEVRLNQLRAISNAAKNRTIQVDEGRFREFILTGNRVWNVALLVTVSNKKCTSCSEVEASFRKVAQSFEDPSISTTFFMELSATQEQGISNLLLIESAPQLLVIKPDNLKCFSNGGFPVTDFDEEVRISRCDVPRISGKAFLLDLSHEIEMAVNKRSAQSRRISSRMTKILFAAVGIIGLILYYLEKIQKFLVAHQRIIAGIGLTCFWLSTSGIIKSVQSGIQLHGQDWETGKFEWIAKGRRSQYLPEGLVFSFLSIFISAILLFTSRMAILFYGKQDLTAAQMKRRTRLMVAVAVTLCLVNYFAYKLLIGTVRQKIGFAGAPFMPPEDFVRGPIRRDRMFAY